MWVSSYDFEYYKILSLICLSLSHIAYSIYIIISWNMNYNTWSSIYIID